MSEISLREYIERILEENRQALIVAEQEREKAAEALRGQLSVQIEQGDKALAAHVTAQIESVKAALTASEKLSAEVQRSQKEGVEKALVAQKEIAEKHNDLIRAAERRDETYALKSDVHRISNAQARLAGGAVVASVMIGTILRLANVG